MKKFVIFILCLLIYPSFVFAARPLSTDDAGTVDTGHWEIESGFEYADQADNEYTCSTNLKLGLHKRWDIGAEIPYKYIAVAESDNVDGISDVVVCSKYRFLDESESFPALAFTFSIKTKSGDKDRGLGTEEIDYALTTILSKELKKAISHINLGYTYVGAPEGENHDDVFSYAWALEYPFNDRLNLVGEFSGETNFEGDFDDNAFAGLAGFNYAFSDTVTFDFGVGWGISQSSPDYTITTGLTFSF